MKKALILTITMGCILTISSIVTAETMTVTTANGYGADSYINYSAPETNYGTDGALYDMNWTRKIFLRFDISDLPDNADITGASLILDYSGTAENTRQVKYLSDVSDGETNDNAPGQEGGWGETTLTWNNQPGWGGGGLNLATAVPDGITTFTNVVTGGNDLMVDFLNADTNGLVTFIIDAPNDWSAGTMASKENTSRQAPTLQIGYVPEPATLGLLSVGAIGLLARRKRK